MKILICAVYSDVNDYIRLLTEAYVRAGHTVVLGPSNFLHSNFEPDIVHLHWPEQLYKTNNHIKLDEEAIENLRERLVWFKSRNATLVYTIHNLSPHETADIDLEEKIYRLFARNADICIHHGEASVLAHKEKFPEFAENKQLVVPHGAYDSFTSERIQSMREYGVPSNKIVLLNFGLQRPYKGASFISRVFSQLNHKELHLFTIGPLSPRPRGLIQTCKYALLTITNKILAPVRTRFGGHTRIWKNVPNEEIPCVMACADVVILGHQSGLTSGLISLAASYAKAVVYPDIGNFREQVDGWPWAESYEVGVISSAVDAVNRVISRWPYADSAEIEADNLKWVGQHSWDSHVKIVTESVSKNHAVKATDSRKD